MYAKFHFQPTLIWFLSRHFSKINHLCCPATNQIKQFGLPHDDCSISVPFYRHCTGTVQQPWDSRVGAMRSSQEPSHCAIFCSKTTSKNLVFSARLTCDHRAMPVRGSCNAPTKCLRGYILTIFNFLYNSELNKIVEARTTLRRPKTV